MSDNEFSVCQFFEDGSYEYVKRGVGPQEAVETAHSYATRPAALMGIIRRVIITDGGDNTNFEWKFGEGVTYPPHDGTRFVADEAPSPPPGVSVWPPATRHDDAGGIAPWAVRALGFDQMCRCGHSYGLHDADACAVLGCECRAFSPPTED